METGDRGDQPHQHFGWHRIRCHPSNHIMPRPDASLPETRDFPLRDEDNPQAVAGGSIADREAGIGQDRAFSDVHRPHFSPPRSHVQIPGKRVDLLLRAAGHRFHRPVVQVPHPTPDAGQRCRMLRERAVTNALHASTDDKPAGGSCCSFGQSTSS